MLILALPLTFLGVSLLTILYDLYAAWVITILWGWFVQGFFHQPPLDYRVAVGLLVMLGLLRAWNWQPEPLDSKEKRNKTISAGLYLLVGPLLALFMGFVIHIWLH